MNEKHRRRAELLYPPDGWHRFVTSLCLIACIGITWVGVSGLIELEMARDEQRTTMETVLGTFFLLLMGIQGSLYLVRQLRARGRKESTGVRRKQDAEP